MKVNLAGYNIDTKILKKISSKYRKLLTPETLSCAYAWISRYDLPIDKLREKAISEIQKVRKTNKRIIFEMGHSSIAEHSVFNIDIIKISRLAVEEIEHFRFASYTEKSQRYVKLKEGFYIPSEIKNSKIGKNYEKIIKKLFLTYEDFIKKGIAKEDARYLLPLATYTQLGMTINARSLEYMLRKFSASSLSEIKELGKKIFNKVKKVAPSLLRYYQATDYELKTKEELKNFLKEIPQFQKIEEKVEEVRLIAYHNDDLISKALLYPYLLKSFPKDLSLSKEEREKIIKKALKYLEFYDPVLREFELGFLVFEIIISAAAFAQLKRHRLVTLISQPYNPELKFTIPKSIIEKDLEKEFRKRIEEAEELFYFLKEKLGIEKAQYILTNAHRKRILIGLNPRELYHISRLREDKEAQWEIRELTKKMSNIAKEKMPEVFILLGGKDKYPEIYYSIYQKYPKAIPK
ncbi:MAG: FAD-dependent thymidylate synthase [candidate division WOR-3 bacterium]|nr:FAD-dependent thymidylate synthase [candidate division WOR-3 bacterium]MDW8113519.1 FAD-dependent thymidylate synthase [candidate division WOR-3 bacterium]